MFDTHALFEEQEALGEEEPYKGDPADARLNNQVRSSMSKVRDAELTGDPSEVRKS